MRVVKEQLLAMNQAIYTLSEIISKTATKLSVCTRVGVSVHIMHGMSCMSRMHALMCAHQCMCVHVFMYTRSQDLHKVHHLKKQIDWLSKNGTNQSFDSCTSGSKYCATRACVPHSCRSVHRTSSMPKPKFSLLGGSSFCIPAGTSDPAPRSVHDAETIVDRDAFAVFHFVVAALPRPVTREPKGTTLADQHFHSALPQKMCNPTVVQQKGVMLLHISSSPLLLPFFRADDHPCPWSITFLVFNPDSLLSVHQKNTLYLEPCLAGRSTMKARPNWAQNQK